MSIQSTDSSRSWFCVLNIHCLYVKDDSELYTEDMDEATKEKRLKNTMKLRELFGDMTPEEIVDAAIERWVRDKPHRTCAVNYEIGDTGNEHLHMVLCDPAKTRFSTVLKKYPGIHCDSTKGSKEQAEDYILKRGRFEEKEHTVVVPARFYGAIRGKTGASGNLAIIEELLEQGKTPREIFDISIEFRKHEKIVRDAFFAKRINELPTKREVNVVWHIGKAGSGKSYTYVKLAEKYGEDEVYFVTDYANGCSGSFDLYCAQKILFLDEFKGHHIPYGFILTTIEGYKSQIHCRYANAYSVWNEVHFTSVLTPEECYCAMVKESDRNRDDIQQFLRRINTIVYHHKEDDNYLTFELPMSEYKGYKDLVIRALKSFGIQTNSTPTKPLPGW